MSGLQRDHKYPIMPQWSNPGKNQTCGYPMRHEAASPEGVLTMGEEPYKTFNDKKTHNKNTEASNEFHRREEEKMSYKYGRVQWGKANVNTIQAKNGSTSTSSTSTSPAAKKNINLSTQIWAMTEHGAIKSCNLSERKIDTYFESMNTPHEKDALILTCEPTSNSIIGITKDGVVKRISLNPEIKIENLLDHRKNNPVFMP